LVTSCFMISHFVCIDLAHISTPQGVLFLLYSSYTLSQNVFLFLPFLIFGSWLMCKKLQQVCHSFLVTIFFPFFNLEARELGSRINIENVSNAMGACRKETWCHELDMTVDFLTWQKIIPSRLMPFTIWHCGPVWLLLAFCYCLLPCGNFPFKPIWFIYESNDESLPPRSTRWGSKL